MKSNKIGFNIDALTRTLWCSHFLSPLLKAIVSNPKYSNSSALKFSSINFFGLLSKANCGIGFPSAFFIQLMIIIRMNKINKLPCHYSQDEKIVF